jgi:hypothetical protein
MNWLKEMAKMQPKDTFDGIGDHGSKNPEETMNLENRCFFDHF